jgi:uncharacterized protein (TIGR03435 family)
MGGDAGRIHYTAVNLENLLSRAYPVKGSQITRPIRDGGPQEQVPAMLRGLLEERFQLPVHRETRELPGYEMVQAKGGPKMEPSPEEGRPRIRTEGGGDGILKMKARYDHSGGFGRAGRHDRPSGNRQNRSERLA